MKPNGMFTNEPRVAGRRVIARPLITIEEWNVLVFPADAEPELIMVLCEPSEFGAALRKISPAYDITDPSFDYVRELVQPSVSQKD